MGRVRRVDVGGMVYHGWNRANFRSRLFQTEAHYQGFLALVEESLNSAALRIPAYCLMPNHGHVVLYPRAEGDLSKQGSADLRAVCLRVFVLRIITR